MCLLKLLWYFLYLCWDEPHLAPFIRSEWPVMFWTTRALTMQRYQNGHRIFDTLLKPRRYHRFGGPQFSGMILTCFLGGRTPVVS